MIVSELKDDKEILKVLEGYENIFLVGCGECATVTHSGGETEVIEMRKKLQEKGKVVQGYVIPREACHIPLIKKELRIHKEEVKNTDAILVLSCGAGVQAVSSAVNLPVFSASNTLFLGTAKRYGRFTEFCSMCGDCVLNETAGICPVTRCPKGLLNGPCGGVLDNGNCEVNPDEKCVWIEIYEKLKKQGRQNDFMNIHEPKDFSKKIKPGKFNVKGL